MAFLIKYMLFASIFLYTVVKSEDGFFYGGSISYKLESIAGKRIANVELITGWELTKGPCGDTCSEQSVNSMTNAKRDMIEQKTETFYCFGNFSSKHIISSSNIKKRDLSHLVHQNYTESVIGVSESSKWEQEIMTFSIVLEYEKEYIEFYGTYWRPLMSGNKVPWKIQSQIDSSIRSDTNGFNNCPQVVVKPFYRVKLNQSTTIWIPMIDPDGDFVRCEKSQFTEIGSFQNTTGIHILKQDQSNMCKVTINASIALGYSDNTWVMVPITFRDFNIKKIHFGTVLRPPVVFALSSASTQFTVQVLENLVTPEFVAPTMKVDHLFIVYAGTTWTTDIYAIAPENTTIDRFIQSGRNGENVTLSSISQDTMRERVAYTTMSWEPSSDEIGQHVLCIRVVDSTGVDSDELLCYTLEVRGDTFNHSSTYNMGKPYFIDIPSRSQFVNCKINATCYIPVYAKSSVHIKTIDVVNSYVDKTSLSKPFVVSYKGENVSKAVLAFTHSMTGVQEICLIATDENNVTSETVCINSEIDPPDPCLSTPCQNSAICKSNRRAGTFTCECTSILVEGYFCEKVKDPCDPSPCIVENMRQNISAIGKCFCVCKPGFAGDSCEQNIDDCLHNTCISTGGICRDLNNKFTCDCYQRYNGPNCEVDMCPHEPSTALTCPANGCVPDPCSGNGVCSQGGQCICPIGYSSDRNCSTSIGYLPENTGLRFVPPTPTDKSVFSCFIVSDDILPCHLPVFVVSTTSKKPQFTLETSDDISNQSHMGNVTKSTVPQGINNVFRTHLLIRGIITSIKNQYVCITANDGLSNVNICLQLEFSKAESSHTLEKNVTTAFIDPTQVEGSTFTGYIDDRHTIILFTTSNSPCENVISITDGVTVFPTFNDGMACVTETSFVFKTTEPKHICFLSARRQFQKRCFVAVGKPKGYDPCSSSTCQNGGYCFPKQSMQGYQCICKRNFIGNQCQEGPCPNNDCKNGAYCKIKNITRTCLCKAGYAGIKCEKESSKDKQEMTFKDAAKPKVFECVLYQPCSIGLLLSGEQKSPHVNAGYVSPMILVSDIHVQDLHVAGTYQVIINVVTKQVGLKDVCIQSFDSFGINKDELCFKVNVTTEISTIYGFKNRPHFLFPSLPNEAQIECLEDEPCHVLYEITSGEGHERDCVTPTPLDIKGISNYHIFTSCETCVPGQANIANCSVDISIQPLENGIQSQRFCLALSLNGTSEVGEKRCFILTIKPKRNVEEKEGCQLIECKNGGFCDGHIPLKPKCFCKTGYFGDKCDKEGSSSSLPSGLTNSFLGDLGIPSELKCNVGTFCYIPFEILIDNGMPFKVSLGYVDPRLSANKPSYSTIGNSSTVSIGSVQLNPYEKGSFQVCLQVNVHSETTHEFCVSITVSDTSRQHINTGKPHFTDPTISADSTILCQINSSCHLKLYSTNGDKFAATGKCPLVSETSSDDVKGLHIFTPEYLANNCLTDVMFIAKETRKLCFQVSFPGKRGENRCFSIKTVPDISHEVNYPCSGISCKNGGKCISDLTATPYKASCICLPGFRGNDCKLRVDNTISLQQIDNILNGTLVAIQTFDIYAAVPKHVTCDKTSHCCVTFPFHGDSETPLAFGFKDSDLSIISNSTIAANDSQHQLQYFQTCMKGHPGKIHRLCVQTTGNHLQHRVNIDEICIDVEFKNNNKSVTLIAPKLTGDLSNGSSVLCQTSSLCHIPVITEMKSGTCEQIKECGEGITGTHVFSTENIADKCVTNIAIRTSANENMKSLCISAGFGGEETYIQVITNKTKEISPCQKKHCINGGRCMSTSSTVAVCECKQGFSGDVCETVISPCNKTTCDNGGMCITDLQDLPAKFECICVVGFSGNHCQIAVKEATNLPGVRDLHHQTADIVHSFDSSSAVPKELKCDSEISCCVVIPFHGDSTTPPLVGYKDAGLNLTLNTIVSAGNNLQHLHLFQACFKSQKNTTKRICLQTTVNGTYQGTNVDEICFDVKSEEKVITDAKKEPEFSGSFTNGSSLICQPTSVCHIPVITTIKSGHCEQVTECNGITKDIHVLNTAIIGDKCVTDVAVKTTENEITKPICISAGPGGEESTINLITKSVAEFSPCQRKHCVNGGRCMSKSSIEAVCQCEPGYSGDLCDTDVTTTKSKPGSVSTKHSTTLLPTVLTLSRLVGTSKTVAKGDTQKSSKITSKTPLTANTERKVTTDTKAQSSSLKTTATSLPDIVTTFLTSSKTDEVKLSTAASTAPYTVTSKESKTTTVTIAPSSTRLTTPNLHNIVKTSQTSSMTNVDNQLTSASPLLPSGTTQEITIAVASQNTDFSSTPNLSSTLKLTNVHRNSQSVATAITTKTLPLPSKISASVSTTTKTSTTTVSKTHISTTLATANSVRTIQMTPTSSTFSSDLPRTDCDEMKAKEHAKEMVVTGYASCFCMVNGKKVHIIKKRPVPEKKNMIKAAGFGAGGMVGTLTVGVIIYAIVNAKRQPVRRKTAPKRISRVNPDM